MKLIFGNLEDIIFAKKAEIQALQGELNELLKQECDSVEGCGLRSEESGGEYRSGCELCSIKDECRADSKKIFVKADLLEEEMKKILLKVKYLLIELFLSQHKDAYIEYHGLELFPLKT